MAKRSDHLLETCEGKGVTVLLDLLSECGQVLLQLGSVHICVSS